MNLSRPHIRYWIYILCGGIISIIPSDFYSGLSGNHLYLGWPFSVGTVTFGRNWWEYEFSGLHFAFNTIIWFLIILLVAWGFVYYKKTLSKRTKTFILYSFLVVTMVPTFYFLSLGPVLKLSGVTMSGLAVHGREETPLWIRVVYYPLLAPNSPGGGLVNNYIYLWIK